MHKAVMLIVKAHDRQEAVNNAKEFMEEYKEDVWDWYVIGGRWTCQLLPMTKDFFEKSKAILHEDNGFLSQNEVDNKQSELQRLWESLEGPGKNPCSNHYKLPEDGQNGDVLPLSKCLKIVQEWHQDPVEAGQKEEARAKEWLEIGGRRDADGNPYDDWRMYGYVLECAAQLYQQNFSFECNVFNVESHDFSIPKEIDDYFVVMIDMHN